MSKRIQLTITLGDDVEAALKKECPQMVDFRVISQALDARGAQRGSVPRWHYTCEVIVAGEKFAAFTQTFPHRGPLKQKPIIIGAGPAGLFCALRLAEYGVPCILFERGDRAHARMKHIARFWRYGEFDPDNNVCYGEGGAGLFSDGKLITRIKSPHVDYVMQRFVDFGAPPETAYISNPHLGSNKIRALISSMTDYLRSKGCEIHYNARVDELLFDQKQKEKIVGVKLHDGRVIDGEHVVLATGHSAHEIYDFCLKNNIKMKAKDFAVGVRIEHPRRLMDKLQHGQWCTNPELGSARYRLSWENPDTHKGTYSFCMCPGGYVLSSGTDADGIVVNGMSNYARNSPWSNSALVVSVKSGEDFKIENALSGHSFLRKIETRAYQHSLEFATGKEVPAQSLFDFLDGSLTQKENMPKSSCPSGLVSADINSLLPKFVGVHLKRALKEFDRMIKGFVTKEALLLAPETRTSAPVTIERDRETLMSISHQGLYPCGEGAGYAGGITSAAVDGVKVAESILHPKRGQ